MTCAGSPVASPTCSVGIRERGDPATFDDAEPALQEIAAKLRAAFSFDGGGS